jgi:hypothetical protein
MTYPTRPIRIPLFHKPARSTEIKAGRWDTVLLPRYLDALALVLSLQKRLQFSSLHFPVYSLRGISILDVGYCIQYCL